MTQERPPIPGPYLLAIGTIEPRKNHLALLAAWRRLPAPRPRLCILGRRGWECGPIVAALEQAVREDAVVWLEDPDDSTVFQFLRHAMALVYPSRLEGFGFPPLEALRCETPVLAGDTAALREVLQDAAVFCDPLDEDDLAARLTEVVGDASLRADLVAKGRVRAATFAWRECARQHRDVYQEVLA